MGFLPCILAGALLGALYIFPLQAAQAARDGLSTWAASIVPTLGPSMALCLFLCSHMPGKRFVKILSAFLCGSPGGAKLMQNDVYPSQGALHDAALTGVVSPAFFLSALPLWLENKRTAFLLYACHLAGAVLSAFCIRKDVPSSGKALPLSLAQCVQQAVSALLQVGYYIMLGTVTARLFACAFPRLSARHAALVQCILEFSGGTKQLLSLSFPLPVVTGLISFGGLSVLMQNHAYWKTKGLSVFQLMAVRALHGSFSFLLCFFLQNLPFIG